MILLIAEIKDGLPTPNFGSEHRKHMSEKHHAGHRSASVCAWTLLREALLRMGFDAMPDVKFSENGKPFFRNNGVHFSLSHSGKLAAALVSSGNCAIDVECIDRTVGEKLAARCMHANEIAADMDFFECWTKKECLGKLSGRGIPARPCEIDLTQAREAFFCKRISDSTGGRYYLSAVAHETGQIETQWMVL